MSISTAIVAIFLILFVIAFITIIASSGQTLTRPDDFRRHFKRTQLAVALACATVATGILYLWLAKA